MLDTNLNTGQRTCQNCDRIIHGRSDKKFCSEGCRSEANNKRNAAANNAIRNINLALLKNRRILFTLMETYPKGILSVSELLSKGYRMEYHTEIVKTRQSIEQVYCFDYGYRIRHDNNIKIIRKRIL